MTNSPIVNEVEAEEVLVTTLGALLQVRGNNAAREPVVELNTLRSRRVIEPLAAPSYRSPPNPKRARGQ